MSETMFGRILLADDGSAAAQPAREYAVELARVTHAKLTVVCVLEPYQTDQDGDEAIARACALAEHHEVPFDRRIEPAVGISNPGRRIIQAAQDAAADVIVVGARGLGGLGRVLLGSVSTYITHHAPCAVLVAR